MSSLAVLIGCFWLIQPEQFVRPFIHADDLMWEVDFNFYGDKLREEGRWLVFGWMKAFGFGSASFDYKAMVVLWCSIALLLGSAVFGEQRRSLILLFAAALALNPALWALTYWPHSSLPMTAILFLGAFAIFLAPNELTRLFALFLAMIATVLSYQLFSFYLLGGILVGIVLTHADRLDSIRWTRLVSWIATGAAGMLVGVLIQFYFNFIVFRHFGLAAATWRSGEAAALATASRAELVAANLKANLAWIDMNTSGLLWLAGGVAMLALAILFYQSSKSERWKLAAGLALLAAVAVAPLLIPLTTGIALPSDRGSINLWLGLIAVMALPVAASTRRPAKWLGACSLLILILGTIQSLSKESAALASSRAQNEFMLGQLDAAIRSTSVARPRILLIGESRLFETPAGDPDWYARVLVRHQFKGRAESLTFCATLGACPRASTIISEMAPLPIFPAPAALKQKNGYLVLKWGPMGEDKPPGN